MDTNATLLLIVAVFVVMVMILFSKRENLKVWLKQLGFEIGVEPSRKQTITDITKSTVENMNVKHQGEGDIRTSVTESKAKDIDIEG